MALVIADRVRETTSSVGTGAITLTGAFLGFQPFSVIGNGNTTYYAIIDAAAGAWEVGVGTYTSSGNTLSRDTVLSSSNADALVVFASGLKDVICTQPAERAVLLDSATNATIPGITLSGGTANGVAYLNGSKVLTSGSALMFDGTSVFGLASASPEFKLGRASGNQPKLSFGPTSATDFYLQASSATGILRYDAGPSAAWGGIHAWYVDQSEQMRLTSTGLGIGTSSPSQLLTLGNTSSVRGQLYIQAPNGGSPTVTWDNTNSPSGHKFIAYGGGAGGTAAWSLYDATAAAYRLEVSGDGNLGLGVTPSAWAGFTASQVKNAALWSDGNTAFLSANTYFNSGYKYIATAAASQYLQASGVHTWYTAPSGTAGNAISFTQAMTLDASGNLLVGTTSNAYSGKIVGYGAPFVSQNTGTTASDRFYFVNGNGIVGYIQTAGSATSYNTSSDYRLKDITGPITTSGAYIDSLNPVEGTWKADGSTFVGLIAHEVQEASRTNVATGVKDGEQMQGMDYSNAELIANMAAELKSLRQRLAAAGIA